jgi:hypothetical protein
MHLAESWIHGTAANLEGVRLRYLGHPGEEKLAYVLPNARLPRPAKPTIHRKTVETVSVC